MFKNIISPIQAWLLSRDQCVGCGANLSSGARKKRQNESEQVKCKCGRVFIYDPQKKTYRRALFSEIE